MGPIENTLRKSKAKNQKTTQIILSFNNKHLFFFNISVEYYRRVIV